MNAADALRDAAQRLRPATDTPRLDAEVLLAYALGINREDMILRLHNLASPPDFNALITRRLAGEPVAHITGMRDFWTLALTVTADVLVPRPDSETLIEAAIDHFRGHAPQRILDLGTGSGALLLAALDEWPEATGLGVDISDKALAVAMVNAARLGTAERAAFQLGDWGAGLVERFDLILANPPYISTAAVLPHDVLHHEPHLALFAGEDGLDAYRRLAPQIAGLLMFNGIALVEIGFDQGQGAADLFRTQGLSVTVRQDLGKRDRCLEIRT